MGDNIGKIIPANDTSEGLSGLSKDEWLRMCSFFNAARYNHPTTEAAMRLKLGMTKTDAFKPEFSETVLNFGDLAAIGRDFEANVQNKVLELADDIYSYSLKAKTTYVRFEELIDKYDWDGASGIQEKLDELARVWSAGQISGRSAGIKDRIKQILDTLIVEAKSRADNAEKLHSAILDPDKGIKHRVLTIQQKFGDNLIRYQTSFGEESKQVADFRAKVTALESELAALRKKETDEVIVMGTSPLYLLIPIVGPFVLAGVDIGVGVDLAKTRAKIEGVITESQSIEAQLNTSLKFVTHFQSGATMVQQISADIDIVVPQLDKLGRGWRTIAADIQTISTMLGDGGTQQVAGEKWSQFIVTLRAAADQWVAVGKKADNFRNFSVPKQIDMPAQIPSPKAA